MRRDKLLFCDLPRLAGVRTLWSGLFDDGVLTDSNTQYLAVTSCDCMLDGESTQAACSDARSQDPSSLVQWRMMYGVSFTDRFPF